jgi:bacillithiol biosynthesis deacetylase BshB1
MSEVDVLAVFAHPDDLELMVAGTMLKMKSMGYRTGALDVTRGEMGTRGTPEGRAKEAEDAAAILRLDLRENLGLPDGHVMLTDDNRRIMVRAFRRCRPRVILTHQLNDSHPDHHHIAELVREAARLCSLTKYDGECGQARIPAPIVAHSVFSRLVVPSFIVDISDFLEGKMDAIRAHRSQFHDPDSKELETRLTGKNFLLRIESDARYYGGLIDVAAGEPFYVREALNVDDPVALLTRPMNLYS